MIEYLPGGGTSVSSQQPTSSSDQSYRTAAYNDALSDAFSKALQDQQPLTTYEMTRLINISPNLTDDQRTAYNSVITSVTDLIDTLKDSPEASSSQTQSLIANLEMKLSLNTIIFSSGETSKKSQPSFWQQLSDSFNDWVSDNIPW